MTQYKREKLLEELLKAIQEKSKKFNIYEMKEFLYRYFYSDDEEVEVLKELYWNSFGLWKLVDKLPNPTNKVNTFLLKAINFDHDSSLRRVEIDNRINIPVAPSPGDDLTWYAITDIVQRYNCLGDEMIFYIISKYYPVKKLKSYQDFVSKSAVDKNIKNLVCSASITSSLFYIFFPGDSVNIELVKINNAMPVYNVSGQFQTLQYFRKLNSKEVVSIDILLNNESFNLIANV